MPKISIIVAVYAAEKYLHRCLTSLKNQTFSDFEVLLIDDGSKDGSGEICDEFSSKDCRFKVFHKENGGVGSARQCGLTLATGDYIIHVDPDDWVDFIMLEKLYECAESNSCDMVICDFIFHRNEIESYISQKPDSLKSIDVCYEMFGNLHGSCCNKLIKRSLFDKYQVTFPTEMVVWEDLFVCVCLCLNDIKIVHLPEAFYHYDCTSNQNSLVRSVSARKLESMKFFIDYFEKKEEFEAAILLNRKIEAKRTAFLLKSVPKNTFVDLYSEVNENFAKRFDGCKKLDSLICCSLYKSWYFARFVLWVWMLKNRIRRKK